MVDFVVANAKELMHFLDFVEMIPDEDAARDFVREVRWPDGVVCPKCKGMDVYWQEPKGAWQCRTHWCRRRFSARTETLFEHSPIPLRKWLLGMFMFLADHRGISSLRLAKLVDVTQKTAYYQLQRLRRACEIDRDTLPGVVEIDEMHFDGKRKNQHLVKWHRHSGKRWKKQAVLGVFDQAGQVVHLGVMSKESDMEVLVSTLAPGIVSAHKRAHVLGEIYTTNIESALTLLKRIFNSTQLSWEKKHAQLHMNEVAFRMSQCLTGKSTVESMQTMIGNSVRLNKKAGDEHLMDRHLRPAQFWIHNMDWMRHQVNGKLSQMRETEKEFCVSSAKASHSV